MASTANEKHGVPQSSRFGPLEFICFRKNKSCSFKGTTWGEDLKTSSGVRRKFTLDDSHQENRSLNTHKYNLFFNVTFHFLRDNMHRTH